MVRGLGLGERLADFFGFFGGLDLHCLFAAEGWESSDEDGFSASRSIISTSAGNGRLRRLLVGLGGVARSAGLWVGAVGRRGA